MSRLPRISALDVAIAVAVSTALQIEVWTEDLTPRGAAVAAFGVVGALMLLRRVAPLIALVVGSATLLVAVSTGVSMTTPVAPLFFYVLVLYSVGLREDLRRAVAGVVVAFCFVTAGNLVATQHGHPFDWTDVPFVTLISATPWFVGRAMRGRLRESAALQERADWLEQQQLVAIAEERGRIARELHDVVAHSVSVMVVQAGAAEEVLRRDPQRALDPLRSVQETGRQALVEMSRLVGLLREDSEELGLAPQPRLDGLDELLAQVREAGLPVELRVEGDRRSLPLGIELTAYRVVQEGLTNALKHARNAHAVVRLRYGLDVLELEISDDGDGMGNGHVGGHGLIGMRERVTIFGGEFSAGPRPNGGFSIHAVLPLVVELQ